jgi:ABC-type uncharacterized transport system permease subunit
MLLAIHLATVGATAVFLILALIDIARWAIVRRALKRRQPAGEVRRVTPLATLQRLVVRWAVASLVFASAALMTGTLLAYTSGLAWTVLWPKVIPAIAAWLLLGVALWRGQLTGWRLSQLRMALLFVAILLLVASLASMRM